MIIHMETEEVLALGNKIKNMVAELQGLQDQLNQSLWKLAVNWSGGASASFQKDATRMFTRWKALMEELDILQLRLRREVEEWQEADRNCQSGYAAITITPGEIAPPASSNFDVLRRITSFLEEIRETNFELFNSLLKVLTNKEVIDQLLNLANTAICVIGPIAVNMPGIYNPFPLTPGLPIDPNVWRVMTTIAPWGPGFVMQDPSGAYFFLGANGRTPISY